MNDRWWKDAEELVRILGGQERLLAAFRKARSEGKTIVIESRGVLMGGKLTVRLELDGRVTKGIPLPKSDPLR